MFNHFLFLNILVHNRIFELLTGIILTTHILQLWCKMRACFVSMFFVFVQKSHFPFLHLKRAQNNHGSIYVDPQVIGF